MTYEERKRTERWMRKFEDAARKLERQDTKDHFTEILIRAYRSQAETLRRELEDG